MPRNRLATSNDNAPGGREAGRRVCPVTAEPPSGRCAEDARLGVRGHETSELEALVEDSGGEGFGIELGARPPEQEYE